MQRLVGYKQKAVLALLSVYFRHYSIELVPPRLRFETAGKWEDRDRHTDQVKGHVFNPTGCCC